MSSFDAQTRKAISAELELAARIIAKKYGMEAVYESGRYGAEDYTLKMKFSTPKSAEVKENRSNMLGSMYFGLPANIVGRSFVARGEKLTVTEIVTRRHKNPVGLVNAEGKHFKCSADYVKQFIKD